MSDRCSSVPFLELVIDHRKSHFGLSLYLRMRLPEQIETELREAETSVRKMLEDDIKQFVIG